MDLGPQIAVWLQDSTGAFVDTLMVTNATSVRGIGNRPGRWDFLSGPLFPYGKRIMSLPIWAHARGKTYGTLFMQEETCAVGGPGESCLGWHESYSSPELYYCRPLQQSEAQAAIGTEVDAITCPTKFNSEKGKFDPTMPVLLPAAQRSHELHLCRRKRSADVRGDQRSRRGGGGDPAVRRRLQRNLVGPLDAAARRYTLMVEVNKEYDSNASHMHPDFDDSHLPGYGTDGNFGQPSVVYQVPIHIDVTTGTTDAQATSQIVGYGDWTGRRASSTRATPPSRPAVPARARRGCW